MDKRQEYEDLKKDIARQEKEIADRESLEAEQDKRRAATEDWNRNLKI